MIYRILLISLFTLSFSSAFCQLDGTKQDDAWAEDNIFLDGVVTDYFTGDEIPGVKISVTAGGKTTASGTSDGKGEYKTVLEYDKTYTITFSKPGFVSKTITMNTNGVPDLKRQKVPDMVAEITLFKPSECIKTDMLNQPIGRAVYFANKNVMDWDMEYSMPKLEKLNKMLDKCVKEQEEKEEQYKELMKIADKAFSKDDYETALTNYKNALNVFPEEEDPKKKIKLIETELAKKAEIEKQKAEEKARAEAEALAKAEAEAAAKKAEEERLAKEKAEAEAEAKAEAEALAKAEAEAAAKKAEEERLAKEKAEAEALAKAEAEAKALAEAKAAEKKEEEERKAKEQAKKEAEEKAKAEAEAKAKAEKEAAKKKAEEERKAKEEVKALAKAKKEAESKAKAEKELAEKKAELERIAKEKAEKLAKEKAEAEAKELAKKEAAAKKAEKERIAKEKAAELAKQAEEERAVNAQVMVDVQTDIKVETAKEEEKEKQILLANPDNKNSGEINGSSSIKFKKNNKTRHLYEKPNKHKPGKGPQLKKRIVF